MSPQLDLHLERVQERIATAILDFAKLRRREFHMDDLRRHIQMVVGPVAPDSPGRVLRSLRTKGRLKYKVLSRRDSLYQIIPEATE